MNAAITIANENIAILKQAKKLITDLSDTLYANNNISPYRSGVGKHIRHILDFYTALASASNGKVNYDRRERLAAVETRREQAIETIGQIIRYLESIQDADRVVMSKNDDGGHRRPDHAYSSSTIGRELQFLVSHSVHHFALITMILLQQGYTPPKDFGVATSTLIHWQKTGYPDSP